MKRLIFVVDVARFEDRIKIKLKRIFGRHISGSVQRIYMKCVHLFFAYLSFIKAVSHRSITYKNWALCVISLVRLKPIEALHAEHSSVMYLYRFAQLILRQIDTKCHTVTQLPPYKLLYMQITLNKNIFQTDNMHKFCTSHSICAFIFSLLFQFFLSFFLHLSIEFPMQMVTMIHRTCSMFLMFSDSNFNFWLSEN